MYFVLMGEWNPSKKVIHTKGKTFQSAKRKAGAKVWLKSSLRGYTLGIFACNFRTSFPVS